MPETRDHVKEITDKLETGIKDLFTSDKYFEYLKTMSKFYHYSTRNTLLIYSQMPGATKVASFMKWKKDFERNVKRGEKGIWILAPTPVTFKKEMDKLDPDTQTPLIDDNGDIITEEVQFTIPKFKAVPIFDISQTDGKPLPSLAEDLTGDVRQYEAFMDALKQVSPLPIDFAPLDGKDGVCKYGEKITICEGMSEIQTVCTVIHEITHAKLHDLNDLREQDENVKPKDKLTKEVEAESVSWTICQYYGIETGANSFGYVATWSSSRELPELNASLDTIRKTAAVLIDSIDAQFKEIAKERSIDLTAETTERETAVLPEQAAYTPLTDLNGEIISQEQPPQELEYDPDEVFRALNPLVISRALYDETYLNVRKDFKDEKNARIECGYAVKRVIEKLWEKQEHLDLYKCYFDAPGFKERLENYVFKRTYTDIVKQLKKISRMGKPKEERENTTAHRNYRVLMKLMPEVIEDEYDYMRFQAGEAFMPLTFEKLSGNRYALMHYYMQNGDMMRDPDMELVIDREKHTANAMTYTQHPYIHQNVQHEGLKIQRQLNSFLSQWLKNIEQQHYKPEIAKFHNEISDMTEKVYFNSDRKPYTVHMGHLGNGLTVWNTLEEVHGDYKRIAHIGADRTVKYYDDKLPPAVKAMIEEEAHTSEMTVSTTQDTPIFNTPPQSGEYERNDDVIGTFEEIEREYPPYEGIMPDKTIGLAERNAYGYVYNGLLPLNQERALELFDNGDNVFRLYENNAEGMITEREEIFEFAEKGGIFGIEVEDWERSSIYAEMVNAAENGSIAEKSNEHITMEPKKTEKEYDLDYGFLGIGITIWNRAEKRDNEFPTVAHIAPDRSVTIYDNNMPDDVKRRIEKVAQSPDTWAFGFSPAPESGTISEKSVEINTIENDGDYIMPDHAISFSERDLYGYKGTDMLPLLKERALEFFDADHTIYMLYQDGTEAMAFEREEIAAHDGIFGIEAAEWIASHEYADMVKTLDNNEASKESMLIYGNEDAYAFYQLKSGEEMEVYRNESLDTLHSLGLSVERGNYELIYSALLKDGDTPESLYLDFNIDISDDFTGNSPYTSDVIVMQQNGIVTSYYVDKFDFKELPAFLGNERKAEYVNEHTNSYAGLLREHISNHADTGYLTNEQEKLLLDNLDTLNAKMLAVSETYENGMPLDVETDTIDRLFKVTLEQVQPEQQKTPPGQKNSQSKADGKGKPSILAQIENYKTTLSQGKDLQKNSLKHDNNKEV